VVWLIWLGGCSPTPELPLRVGTLPWPGYESLHLAQSLSYFDPARIRLTDMSNSSQILQAIRNGTLDASFSTLDEALGLIQDGVDLRVLMVMDVSNGADVVMVRSGIVNLRGKRVGVENTAVGALMLDAALEASGVNSKDIKLIGATIDEHLDLYKSRKVDALVTFEPVRSELLKQGAHILFDSSQIPGRILDVMIVRTDKMAEHAQALKELIAAHFRALNYQARDPQDAAKRIAPYLGVSEADVSAQYDGIKIPSLAENYSLLSGSQPKLTATAADLADLMLNHKLLAHAVNSRDLAEPKFLPAMSQ
jgi:NitT/TauT family transport system substrate-binding protein